MDLNTFLDNFDTIAEAPGGIAKLKALILDLAVRGKLVSQDLEDEPSEANLMAMRVQRTQWLKEQSDSNQECRRMLKKLSTLESAQPHFEVPETWTCAHLIDLSLLIVDCHNKTAPTQTNGIPLIRTSNIRNGKFRLHNLKYVSEETYQFWSRRCFPQPGDIIFTREAPMGEAAIIPQGMKVCLGQRTMLIRVLEEVVDRNFLLLTLIEPGLLTRTSGNAVGMTVLHLRVEDVEQIVIAVPPLAEQKRIVEKVDELMALCDRLAAAKQTRDDLRQKLRGSAIAALMNAETDEALEKSWAIVRDNWHSLSQDPKDVDDLRQSVLQLAVQGKLVQHTDSFKKPLKKFLSFQNGYAFKSEWYEPKGMRLVRNQNIGHGNLRWEEVRYIDPQKAEEFKRFALRESDIVISLDRPIINSGLKIALIKAEDIPSLLLQRVARPFFKDDSLSPEYFFMWLNSPEFTRAIDPGRSNGVPHISTGALEKIEILVPLLSEQKRIVAKVDELMQMCDQLEASLRQSQQRAAALAASAISYLTI